MNDETEDQWTDDELIAAVTTDCEFAATEIARRLRERRMVILRCANVLNHMAIERPNGWRRAIFGRWMISDEPLRGDAAHLLPIISQCP